MSDSNDPQALGEFGLIETYFRPLTLGRTEALRLLDDAGILTVAKGEQLVVTTDALVAGRHFLADGPAEDLGLKVLGVNLSDLAAMGAKPLAYTLALAAPKSITGVWLESFTDGLAAAQALHGIFLLGGDTVSTDGPLTLSITAMGTVPTGQGLLRSGARVGDDVYVSGTIGDAALGLLVARDGRKLADDRGNAFLRMRYDRPQPRCLLGPRLIGLATACADVSDGLAADAGHIAETSGVGIEIRVADLPLSSAALSALAADPTLLTTVVAGGDDYELVFTAPPEAAPEIRAAAIRTGIEVTRIGAVIEGSGVRVIDRNGADLELGAGGYRHL